MRIEQVTAFLYSLKPKGIRFGLENTKLVLENLGRPDKSLIVVHVVGSNGKGSTAAFLESILAKLRPDLKVGLFTSPHLTSFRERFRINQVEVGDQLISSEMDRFLEIGLELNLNEVEQWIEGSNIVDKMSEDTWYKQRGEASRFCRLTFFECTTVLAIMIFATSKVDLAIMECGMGGRLDATNVLDPVVSVITPIHLEHTEWLGNTISLIAAEKAGVIKAGVPVICAKQEEDALRVIQKQAAEQQAPTFIMGASFDASGDWKNARFRLGDRTFPPIQLGLVGNHQLSNAACALACLEHLEKVVGEISLDDKALKLGLSDTKWPARFEFFGPHGCWILDGAHNPDGIGVVVDLVNEIYKDQKLDVLFGVLGDKDVTSMISKLGSIAQRFHLVKPNDARGRDPETIEPLITKIKCKVYQSLPKALSCFLNGTKDSPNSLPILITGSLTTVGEARSWLIDRGIMPTCEYSNSKDDSHQLSF